MKISHFLVEILFFIVLVLTPIALGGNRSWAWMLAELTVFSTILIILLSKNYSKKVDMIPIYLLFGVVTVSVIQLMSGLLIINWGDGISSYTPSETLVEIGKLISYIGVYFIVAKAFSRKRSFLRLVKYIWIAVCFQLLLSVIGYILKDGYLYTAIAYTRYFKGSFLNFNHFASFISMFLPLLVASAIISYIRFRDGHSRNKYPIYVQVLCVILLEIGVLLSGSRGALLFQVLAYPVSLLFFFRFGKTRIRFPHLLLLVVGFVGVLLAGFAMKDSTLKRFSSTAGSDGRHFIYNTSIKLIADKPLLGHGLGSYEQVNPVYKSPYIMPRNVRYAHSEILQSLVELGFLGTFFYCAFIMYFYVGILRSRVKLKRQEDKLWLWGIVAGVTFSLGHSLVEFTFHMPAIAIGFMTLIGVGINHTKSILYKR